MSNTFGKIYTLTTFGESHGEAIGGIIDGCPDGIKVDVDAIQRQLDRRRPGQSDVVSARNESDRVKFLSGIYDGYTTGAPIGFIIENRDQRSRDYNELANVFRPNHADYTYFKKYKGFADMRGGGRASARETATRVVAGSLAQQILSTVYPSLSITAYTQAVGTISLSDNCNINLNEIDNNPVRCPDPEVAVLMREEIVKVKGEGDTVGGVVKCIVKGCPVGIGEPVYGKLSAKLAEAMMSINAAKGFEIGDGFSLATKRGSETLDTWVESPNTKENLTTVRNTSGGVQGGISNGNDIVFKVAFKPAATILKDIETVDRNGHYVKLKLTGRHDPCVVPRAVPVVEAMTAMVLLDLTLINRARQL